jgi:hypothetical protein
MQRQPGGIPAFMLVVIALVIFGGLVLLNSRPSPSLRVIVPTQSEPTQPGNAWEQILQQGFGSNSTPLPTVAIPTANFVAPTLAINAAATPLAAAELGNSAGQATQFSVAATPTRPPATIAPLETDIPVTQISVTRPPTSWQPPPLIPPISRDIFHPPGRFQRDQQRAFLLRFRLGWSGEYLAYSYRHRYA